MSLSPQWLDELRARITLSAVVGRTTRLTKAGREFKACCPFHNEKSPSFTVNDEKGFYHCFGCGAHGDVIRWMTDQRGLGFMDAVKELAAEAGMEVPAPDPQSAQRAQQQAGLHEVMAAAQAFFVGQLAGDEGARARAYLATRGFGAETVTRFGFGYAPEGRQALKAALRQFPEGMLVEAGLRIVVDDKEPYDRFRGRLMLPIEDARGRVIAFGGRILDGSKAPNDSGAPKYLNSPDTPLFDKGRTLYNLHRAGPVSRQSGRLVVVEGYMDAIALAAAGIGDAVAPLGTALTERQIEMAWRLVETPVLCFDGDNAGRRAAMRAIARALPLLRPAHSLAIARIPAGQDPDDVVKSGGARAMETLLGEAASLIDALWEHERDAEPLPSPEAKAGLKARLMAHVETIGDADIKALYRRELTDRFSAFAFPARQFTPRQPGAPRGGRGTPWRTPPAPSRPLAQTAALLARPAGNPHRAAAIAAVGWGLARFPQAIAAHAERLNTLARENGAIAALLARHDAAQSAGGVLESAAIVTILRENAVAEADTLSQMGMHYLFVGAGGNDSAALAELAEAVSLLVERAALDAGLAGALARYESEMSAEAEEDYRLVRTAKERLNERELEMRDRLGQRAPQTTKAKAQTGQADPCPAHTPDGEPLATHGNDMAD